MNQRNQVAELSERSNGLATGGEGELLSRVALGSARDDASQRIGRSIAYMQNHLNRPLQISALAALVNVSPSHFFALFKRQTGSPPGDYFTRLRMRHACLLLDTTPASVKEVAAALGYNDPFYFSRVFKSVCGVAPRQYRLLPNFQQ